jgi:hypothetical protein
MHDGTFIHNGTFMTIAMTVYVTVHELYHQLSLLMLQRYAA